MSESTTEVYGEQLHNNLREVVPSIVADPQRAGDR
jgi:hypothetical protein